MVWHGVPQGAVAVVLVQRSRIGAQDPERLRAFYGELFNWAIGDGPIIAGVNAAWGAQHPSNQTLVVQEADDDGLLWWLSDRSQAATDFVKNYLWTHSAPAVNYAGQTMLSVLQSGASQWCDFYQYDNATADLLMHAMPSAVSVAPASRLAGAISWIR